MEMEMSKKLMKRINKAIEKQEYDENLVLTLLKISNVSRRLAELMLLHKHKKEQSIN